MWGYKTLRIVKNKILHPFTYNMMNKHWNIIFFFKLGGNRYSWENLYFVSLKTLKLWYSKKCLIYKLPKCHSSHVRTIAKTIEYTYSITHSLLDNTMEASRVLSTGPPPWICPEHTESLKAIPDPSFQRIGSHKLKSCIQLGQRYNLIHIWLLLTY